MYCRYALSWFLHSYELHISLSCSKKERHNITIALVRIHKYHIYWETWGCHTMETLSFILKTYKNSETMVEQRTWDIVLDLIILSLNWSRPKWRLISPWLKVIWVSLKVRSVYSKFRGEFLIECMCTFEAWNHCSNSWSIAEFSFAQGLAKVKLGGACWCSLTSIINYQHIRHMYLIPSPNIGIGV